MNHFLTRKDSDEVYERMGQFMVNPALFMKNAEALFAVMKDVIVIRCEYIWPRGEFHYIAISKHFDLLAEGASAPFYYPEVKMDNDQFIVSWKKGGQFDRFALTQ